MTIHKGQSGQFDRVSVIRPGSPLLTHELLYTAMTRARTHLRIIGTEESDPHHRDRTHARAHGLRR